VLLAQAMSWQTPPAALILFSAILENILARTMQGLAMSSPFPQTLKKPYSKQIEVYYLIKKNLQPW